MTKLKDIIGSRYVTEGNVEKLTAWLIQNEDEVVDLDSCLITHSIASIVERNPKRFIDTTDAERGRILELNRESAELREKKKEVPLPNRDSSMSIIDYIKSLSNDEIYSIVDEQKFPLAAIVLIFSPKKRLSFGYLTGRFGSYLSNYLYHRDISKVLEVLSREQEFFLYRAKNLESVRVESYDEDSIVTTKGTFDILELFSSVSLLPACIGTQRINDKPFYQGFWQAILEEVYAPENKEMSLFELLQRK